MDFRNKSAKWLLSCQSSSVFTLDPFAMCRALPGSDYYGSSATSQPGHRTMQPAPGRGKAGTLPTFTRHRSKNEALGFTPEGMSHGHVQRPAGPGQRENDRAVPHPQERTVTSTPPISIRLERSTHYGAS